MTLRYYQAVLERNLVNWHRTTVLAQEWSDLHLVEPWDISKMRANREVYMECVAEGNGISKEIRRQRKKHDDDWNDLQSCIRPVKRLPPLHLVHTPADNAPEDERNRVLQIQDAMVRLSDFMERVADAVDMGDGDMGDGEGMMSHWVQKT